MAIITATAVTIYAPKITATAGTITSSDLIDVVQERIQMITNNYFNSDDLCVSSAVTFNATANTITLDVGENWEDYGFQAGDDFLIYRSWRNDSVKTILSLADNVLTLTTACSCIDERYNSNNGPIVYFSVVQWPKDIQYVAAKMIWFDYDYRDKNAQQLKSYSLGPLSESFGSANVDDEYGYPIRVIQSLDKYKIARLM
ncbi:MAG: hypothetical protein WC895_04130 [Candidatus Shapirobacteria bacterium]|jgi:hypothetical protein